MIIVKIAKLDKKNTFNIQVDEDNFKIIRILLNKEREVIINKLKKYKSAGLINSITFPRNKQIQEELNEMVNKKRTIKYAIEKINKIFL